MKRHLQCAEQHVSPSNLTKYRACHTKWLACLIVVTYETSFPMRGATGITIQPHQILRLPRKMTLQDFKENPQKQVKRHFQCGADPSMIRAWSEHENANRNPPRNRGYFSTSPRAFSIVKYNVSRPILHSNLHQVLRLPRKVTLERHQVLRLPRKVTLERHQVLRLPQKVPLELHQVLRLPRKVTLELHQVLRLPRKVTLELHQILRLPWKVTLERHQVLHLPRKVTLDLHQVLRLSRRKTHILSPHRIWNVIYSARSNTCHHPTSPNTAPATQNDSHAWSSSHMKPHFQCAEQQVSRSNLTKYCACHEKWHCKISKKISKNRWNVISNAGPIRAWSEHDPSMIRAWKRKPQPASQPRLLFDLTTSIFYCKIQRFAPNLTFKPSPSTAPATKSDTWTSPSTAPATKSDTWTSPSTAPATKSDTRTSLLYSTRLYLTLLYLTLLDTTLLDSTWLYLTLLDYTWL